MAEATETTTKEAPKTKASEPDVPVAESGPAIDAQTAVFPPGKGNWSDPPELAEGEAEIEGSFAKPHEDEVAKEREKVVKEGKEARQKALDENAKKAEARAQHDAKQEAK